MIKLNEAGIICILIFVLIGCNQGQQMMKPISQESPTALEEPTGELPPVQEVEVVIDDIVHTTDAFTSAEAALNSQQFQDFLEYARNYNAEWCGALEKPFGFADIDNQFKFTTEEVADDFLTKAPALYPQDIKPSWSEKRSATDNAPSWGIWLSARCE